MKEYNIMYNYEDETIIAAGIKNIKERKKIDRQIYMDLYDEKKTKKEILEMLRNDFIVTKVNYETFKEIRNGRKSIL